MTQESKDKQSALDKIRALLNKTTENGASEAEMENAMKLAQRLMMKHQIDDEDIMVSPLDINILEVSGSCEGYEAKYWVWELLLVIGKCYQCDVIKSSKWNKDLYKRDTYYKIIGETNDRKLVKDIFESILPIIRNLSKQRYKEYKKEKQDNGEWFSNPAIFTRSYIKGFMAGLNNKLSDDRNDYLMNEADKSKWGLIVVKKDDLVERFVKEHLKPKMSKIREVDLVHDAYFMGESDGKEKNGNKQINA